MMSLKQYQIGEDPRIIAALLDPSPRLTSDDVRSAAKKFLRDDQYLDARLMPAGAAAPPQAAPETPPASSNASTAPARGRADVRPSEGSYQEYSEKH